MKTYGISGTSAAVRETRDPAQDVSRHTARAAANHLSALEQVKHDRQNLERDKAALERVQASRPTAPPHVHAFVAGRCKRCNIEESGQA